MSEESKLAEANFEFAVDGWEPYGSMEAAISAHLINVVDTARELNLSSLFAVEAYLTLVVKGPGPETE